MTELSDDALRRRFAKGVYLHAVGGPLTHNTGCLAEGLMALGIPVKLNTAEITSRPVSRPLVGVDAAALVSPPLSGMSGYVLDITHTNAHVPFDGIGDGRLAYLNQSDVATFCALPDGQLLFAAHETRFASKPGRRIPIAFGLSENLINATARRPSYPSRTRTALRNFRATLSQSLRALLDVSFVPALERHMPIDRAQRGPAAYLEALLSAKACLAYGGELYAPIMDNRWFAEHEPALAAMHLFANLDAPALVLRWDSFRLWESFAAGCLTVHLDFEKYGFALPVMPRAWEHYVPIDLDDIAGSADALLAREADWEGIAEAGRAWSVEHYAPAAVARRVLSAMLAPA